MKSIGNTRQMLLNRGVVMKQKRWKYIQLNNSGSALISVVAVAIFSL